MEAAEVADRVSRLLLQLNHWNLICKVRMKLDKWHHTHMASLEMHAAYVLCVMSSLLWNWLQTCVNRLMHPCTSKCNLAGSPSIRCSADFPLHRHPGSIFKILHSASCITPYYPLQSGRIIHACNESLCVGTAIGVYSVCECWDWILQWDRKIGGVSCWVLLILMMEESVSWNDMVVGPLIIAALFPPGVSLMLKLPESEVKLFTTCEVLEVYHVLVPDCSIVRNGKLFSSFNPQFGILQI